MTRMTVEWPTLLLIIFCYVSWGVATTVIAAWWLPAAIVTAALATALHSSLTHEVTHGHPFQNQRLNALLVFPALILVIPFGRFRDTHLDHHRDENLTDPYDDPETNYLDPAIWWRLPAWCRRILEVNNVLAGRMLIGPIVSQVAFVAGDIRLHKSGDTRVARAWLWHLPALVPVALWFVYVASMPFWAYAIAAYAAISLLKIRTFLEHQAHQRASGRTVVIEDRGPLAFLFLNNNLHVVHHMHPSVAWYRLPALYAGNRARYLRRNGGYRYSNYAEVFRRYFWTAKDTVPHPQWPGANAMPVVPEKRHAGTDAPARAAVVTQATPLHRAAR